MNAWVYRMLVRSDAQKENKGSKPEDFEPLA
jgi:hypothetical protein